MELLTLLDRPVEALGLACDDVIARCDGKRGPPKSSEHVAWALSAKAFVLAREERSEDAAKVCSEIIARFGPGSPTPLLNFASRALVERAAHSFDLGHCEEALSDSDAFLCHLRIVSRAVEFRTCSPCTFDQRPLAARDGATFRCCGCSKRFLTRFGGKTEPPVSDYVAYAQDVLRDMKSE